jgi:hypothetical protein
VYGGQFGVTPASASLYGYQQNPSQTSLDLSTLTAGLPSFSSSPVPSPSLSVGRPAGGIYSTPPPRGFGYGFSGTPAGNVLTGIAIDPTTGLPYGGVNGSGVGTSTLDALGTRWSLPSNGVPLPLDGQFSGLVNSHVSNSNYDADYDDTASSLGSAPASAASPNSMSPVSAPSPGVADVSLSAYNSSPSVTMASGQWSNTPLVTQGALDPIEPFFKTTRERNLVRPLQISLRHRILANVLVHIMVDSTLFELQH